MNRGDEAGEARQRKSEEVTGSRLPAAAGADVQQPERHRQGICPLTPDDSGVESLPPVNSCIHLIIQ